ncbi:hypothetical protein IFM89_003885 [Coptis chinensis]|uniref:F-box protein n=1 Tax=Coptis chinensis TaxID=261450 RepID=A0A835HXH3_9MAGN|nr:hypothetical protein IFM89_003885 [Coptis chinensis]
MPRNRGIGKVRLHGRRKTEAKHSGHSTELELTRSLPNEVTGLELPLNMSSLEYCNKVARIQNGLVCLACRKDYQTHVSVYTIGGTSSWKTLDAIPYLISGSKNAVVDGSIHWFASGRPFIKFPKLLVSFDIKEEVF